MQFTDVIYEKSDGKAVITINRPQVMNALRLLTVDELTKAIEDAEGDSEIGVIVIRGAGDRAFCVGGDQKDVVATVEGAKWRTFGRRLQRLFQELRDTTKPTIAAVKGYAVGGGNELHCFCDLTIATENSTFGQVGPKVGGAPLYVVQALPRIVGEKRAKEIMFLCEQYSAADAQRMGLVNRVVPEAQFEATVDDICARLLAMSGGSLRLLKLGIAFGQAMSDAQIPALIEAGAAYFGSPEQREGAEAFVQKRKPDFAQFRKK